jgi:cytochrome c7-like protein
MKTIGLATVLLLIAASSAAAPARTSCTVCHADASMFSGDAAKIVENFRKDVHAEVGLSCQDCHGGNPDPALAEDPTAMDPAFKANPYRGKPERKDIPGFCGRCHSNPDYMKRFRPDIRVDQEREYRTSYHGQALAKGDTKVATCVDCHQVHGILRIGDPRSPVHPKQVAETCKSCHADAKRMAGYKLADGRPLPVNQYALWRQSVHAHALLDREDLSAPTCNDCHGNHGATPPGVGSVAFVCGQCHGREAQLFRASPKQAGFQNHNDLLATAGDQGCAACHEPPDPQAAVKTIHGFTECTTCHTNHAVVRPTVAMLSRLPETPCAFCHEGTGPLAKDVPEPPEKWENYQRTRDALLTAAAQLGFKGEDRFDWLVDRAQALPTHTLTEEGGAAAAPPALRPEFERLFTKFRIGKVHFSYTDPATGKPVRASVVRCSGCHSPSPQVGGEPVGLRTGEAMLARMRELTGLTARAERILLKARRGGVETRKALQDIDGAVDDQIELEVLVHSFVGGPQGAFAKKQVEGTAHARAALAAGQQALDELAFRRRGLQISLALIVLVLIGLALKIRQIGV